MMDVLIHSLALVDLSNPLFWAVFIGWILSVVLHEFAHGLIAYLGGDYTIRERGGLTLNPLQYVDPIFSLLLPAVFFAMGGIPLPGGVTYVRRDLIRNRAWQIAVSAAGPAMNFLLFLGCSLPFHPRIGLMRPSVGEIYHDTVPHWHLFMGTMTLLQILAVLFNLVPVPPLDGFQIVAPLLPSETRRKMVAAGPTLFLLFFIVMLNVPALQDAFINAMFRILDWLGFDSITIDYFKYCYNKVLFSA